ncbi:putative pentatricopeptide repeat-containing protein At3g23330 [Phragmites australis]|uniref:putative pentatricopeptide repeat-containing protein At3g23330 n=1 Tax=Phragmites australis TaxID=29695 RepID=UPI002D79BA7B|nr:putative pentatricopeptide repeat-containing protein At3g23330 [Phragmites australis]
MPKRDVVSWNTLVLGCVEDGRHQEVVGLVRKMWRDGFRPDSFTLSSVLPSFVEFVDVRRGMEAHGIAIRNGFDSDVFIGNSLVDMYARTNYSVNGMKKEPACNWVEVKNELHVFIAHDRSHPWYDRIIGALNVFSEQMALHGYVPNIEDVFQDSEEEQKRCGMWSQ